MTSRERSFRLEAVVLRHSDWGEADRLLTLFSLELGKVRSLAKGARKARSRKAGHLEPFTRVNLLLSRGRDLLIVTQAETIDPYMALREDLLLPTYASYVIELVDRFTYEEGDNPPLFKLLVDTLGRLNTGHEPDIVVRYFEMRLLDLLGFRPQLFQCVSCGEEIRPEDQFFSAEQGGVLCARCGQLPAPAVGSTLSGAWPVSMPALKYMRHFQRSGYVDASRAVIPPPVSRELENLMHHYLTYLLERNLNTPVFLRRARSEPRED